MAHNYFHRPGEWDTGYYRELPATHPSTRGRYAVDFSKQRPYSVIGTNRVPNRYVRGVSPPPNQGILSTVKQQANYDPNTGGPRQYDFLSSAPGKFGLGMLSDIAEGAAYAGEGLETGWNLLHGGLQKHIAAPISDFLADEHGVTPTLPFKNVAIPTGDEWRTWAGRLDTTFDKPQEGGMLGTGEYSNIRRFGPGFMEGVSNLTQDIMGGISETYKKQQADVEELFDEGDQSETKWSRINDFFRSMTGGENYSQEEVSKSITELPVFNENVTNASSNLGQTMASKKEIDMSDPDEKQGWKSNVTNGVNGFLERLGEPGFQTALAMHMAAKDGGDITDVLFAGVKQTNIAQAALMKSTENDLRMQQILLDMEKTRKGMTDPDKPTKTDISSIKTYLMSGKYNLKENVAGLAANAIAKRTEEFVAEGYDSGTALEFALQSFEQSGQLTQDPKATWYNPSTWNLQTGTFNLSAPGTSAAHQAASNQAKAAGQSTYIIGGKTYQVQ